MNFMMLVGIFGFAGVLSLIVSGAIIVLYNIFIGLPLSIMIINQKKYKTVRGRLSNERYANGSNEWREGYHWYTIEWEIDNKKYKRMIHTSEYLSGNDIQLYYLSPKYAMPLPRELAKYRYEIQTLLINWIIFFFIIMNHYN